MLCLHNGKLLIFQRQFLDLWGAWESHNLNYCCPCFFWGGGCFMEPIPCFCLFNNVTIPIFLHYETQGGGHGVHSDPGQLTFSTVTAPCAFGPYPGNTQTPPPLPGPPNTQVFHCLLLPEVQKAACCSLHIHVSGSLFSPWPPAQHPHLIQKL